jgi:hypothetical protein
VEALIFRQCWLTLYDERQKSRRMEAFRSLFDEEVRDDTVVYRSLKKL